MPVRTWKPRRVSTRFIRIPARYWPDVIHGERREFRILDKQATRPDNLIAPCLVVGWREVGGEYDSRLMVLERIWREHVGAITQESLEAEGHFGADAFQSFRHEWVDRTHRPFNLMQEVWAVRLRPLAEGDITEFFRLAFLHLARLYDGHLPDNVSQLAKDIEREYPDYLEPRQLPG